MKRPSFISILTLNKKGLQGLCTMALLIIIIKQWQSRTDLSTFEFRKPKKACKHPYSCTSLLRIIPDICPCREKTPLQVGQYSLLSVFYLRSSLQIFRFPFTDLRSTALVYPERWRKQRDTVHSKLFMSQQLPWLLWFWFPWWNQEHCVGRVCFPCLCIE